MKTLKFFLIVFALTLVTESVSAQRLILRSGLTTSWLSFTYPYKEKAKTGFAFYFSYELPLNEHFRIQPEIGLASKGTNYSLPNNKESLLIYYLEIGLPVKYYFGNSKISILLSPMLGIGIGGKYEIFDPYNESYKIKFAPFPRGGYDVAQLSYLDNRFDFGVQAGVGFELWKKILVDIRYTYGFTKLYTDLTWRTDNVTAPYDNVKNRSFQLTIGIPFNLKKE